MLIIYDKKTGEVVENTGTSSVWAEGPPDELGWINVDNKGLDRSKFEFLRLHDVNDLEIINQLSSKRYRINPSTKDIVLQGPLPEPEPIPVELSIDEKLDALTDLLVAKGAVSREEVDTVKEEKAQVKEEQMKEEKVRPRPTR